MLRAAARRPPPQLLSSALSCTNTTGWQPQPRLRQNMNGFYEEMELQGKSSFLIGQNMYTGALITTFRVIFQLLLPKITEGNPEKKRVFLRKK